MSGLDRFDRLFVSTALIIQAVLVVFFALRKWSFPFAMEWGWIVYALGVPAVIVSVLLIRAHKPWYLTTAGILFGAWAVFGTWVDRVQHVEWRSPILWPVFGPYLFLYLAALMFYWWPLLKVHRGSWFVYAGLYVISTALNMASE